VMVELTRLEQCTYLTAEDNADLPPLTSHIGRSCRRRKVWVLEVGYGSDTKYEEIWQTKTEQHQTLIRLLTHFGYEVHLRPLPLGVAGTIYKTNLTTLVDLGITRHQSSGTLRKLHIHAISCLHNIIKERRYLERFQRHTKDHKGHTQNANCSVTARRGQG